MNRLLSLFIVTGIAAQTRAPVLQCLGDKAVVGGLHLQNIL